MAQGFRQGLRQGFRQGLRQGLSADVLDAATVAAAAADSMAGVSRDTGSNIYVPANSTEWTTTMSAANISSGGPSGLWLLQETGTPVSVADSIGSIALAVGGTPTCDQTVTGWTRKAIVFDDGSTDSLTSSNVGLPDLGTTSMLMLMYVKVPSAAPAAARSFAALGASGTRTSINLTTTPRLEGRHYSSITTGTTNPCDGVVRPVWIRHNRTASAVDMGTEVERISPTFSSVVDNQGLLIGNSAFASAGMSVLYAVAFFGTAAEMTNAQIKTLLETLGWTVSWT